MICKESAGLMPTCTDTIMGLNLHFGASVQKIKNNISLQLHMPKNAKAHSTVPSAEQALNECSIGFL